MNPPTPQTFEAFMQRALYDPRDGYYTRHIRGVGRHGDFTTAPMLSSALGTAMARWAIRAMQASGCRDLIEVGPGSGQLNATVRAAMPWHVRWMTRFHLVESSPVLAQQQRARLHNRGQWHQSLSDALRTCGGRAIIFSNELVDAFPVRRYQRCAEGWRELAVAWGEDGGAIESLLPLAPLPDSTVFTATGFPLDQKVEVHDSYRRWLQEWLPGWRAGKILTIDYGGALESIYHRRPQGTIRAYLHHQRLEGAAIYQNVGRQDLTADVNFSDLIRWSKPWAETAQMQSLADFLGEPADKQSPVDGTWDNMIAAAEAFQVLEQTCKL